MSHLRIWTLTQMKKGTWTSAETDLNADDVRFALRVEAPQVMKPQLVLNH